jgi:DNA-binding NarL/FixJ family response regulator
MTTPDAAQPALRILVVDPDDRIRESLSRLLCIGGHCVVIGGAGGADDAVTIAEAMQPDVVLLDPRLPALEGDRAIVASLRAAAPGVRVLVLNMSDGPDGPRAEGADAYIKKTFRPHELIDAVVAAARPSVA